MGICRFGTQYNRIYFLVLEHIMNFYFFVLKKYENFLD